VIFVDEIDKVGGQSTWESFLRAELYSLLDLKIFSGLAEGDESILTADELAQAQDVLSNRTLVLAAGAFQHIWENRNRPSLGFGAKDIGNSGTNLTHLATTLPRELINRFRSDLIVLPELRECDYRRMLEQSAEKIPAYFRKTFLMLGYQRIPGAVACRQGCRFLEELMLDTIIEEKTQMLDNSVWKQATVCPDDSAILQPEPLALPAPCAEPDA